MDKKTKVRSALLMFGKVICRKDGSFTIKKGYFYSHGMTADKLAEQVKGALPRAKIISRRDHFNAWPKQSWFQVDFTVED